MASLNPLGSLKFL